jgi:hypothetical protein
MLPTRHSTALGNVVRLGQVATIARGVMNGLIHNFARLLDAAANHLDVASKWEIAAWRVRFAMVALMVMNL